MPEKELYLLELGAGVMAESRTGSSKIVLTPYGKTLRPALIELARWDASTIGSQPLAPQPDNENSAGQAQG
jgi:hypothetical protein